jgi:DNA-binding response OmpR family regulator
LLGIRLALAEAMILVVEQDLDARQSLSELLSDRGHRVIQAADATEAIQHINGNIGVELILLDLEIAAPGRVLKHARMKWPNVKVFGMSRHDALAEDDEGIDGFFCKPLVFHEVYREICSAGVRAHRCSV